jgi:hypothetical protein
MNPFETLFLCLVAFGGSMLTFFSGFGLGTLLMPVLALFFPVEIAIGMTAIVHLSNNLFKLALIGTKANSDIILRFGIPSVVAALAGAFVLNFLTDIAPIHTWQWGHHVCTITPLKIVVAVLLAFFSLFELVHGLRYWQVEPRFMLHGGLLSGFFGGLSGHQGALRSAFLMRSGMDKDAFIGTGVAIACMTDLARLSVYLVHWTELPPETNITPIILAVLSAFAGALIGRQFLRKMGMKTVHLIVGIALILFSALLAAGII